MNFYESKIKPWLQSLDKNIEKRKNLGLRYGAGYADSMMEGILKSQYDEMVNEVGVSRLLSLENVQEFSNWLCEDHDLYKRDTIDGTVFTFLEDNNVSIRFLNEEIYIYEGMTPIYQCYSIEELFEKVSLDMRTKKFHNVMKRKSGEQFCKETEKVDMRRKDFKDSVKRKTKREEKKKLSEKYSDYDLTVASITASRLGGIAGALGSKEDLNALLIGCKKAGLNPIPLKNNILAGTDKILKAMHTDESIAYIIKNIEKYDMIASKMFGETEAPEDEEDTENDNDQEKEESIDLFEKNPVKRLLNNNKNK